MRPGESVEIRTPNAVAGIRGTVVIAEVTRKGADVATRFTLLSGVIDVLQLDAARRPIGAAVVLNPLQTISIDGALSPVRSITRDQGKAASAEFAPDPALDPLWISYWEPFHGANKKDFGFKVTLKASVE